MDTLYTRIGPVKLRELVDKFYDIVFYDSEIAHLFDVNNSIIRDKQFAFLSQFLGGPMKYTEQYGQPKMRSRHIVHSIGEAEKDEWLRCMRKAINSVFLDRELGNALFNCFPQVARHMMNK